MDEAIVDNTLNTNFFQHKDLTEVVYEVVGMNFVSERKTVVVWYKNSKSDELYCRTFQHFCKSFHPVKVEEKFQFIGRQKYFENFFITEHLSKEEEAKFHTKEYEEFYKIQTSRKIILKRGSYVGKKSCETSSSKLRR